MEVFASSPKPQLFRPSLFKSVLRALCLLLLCASSSHAWWHEDWELRRGIDLNTTAQNANIQESLQSVPVLLRLHAGNFDFSKAKPDGSDLRFVAGDDLTLLKHEIDTFDIIDEIALIWVNVPEIKANAADNTIYMYYGNEAAQNSQDAAGAFSSSQALVYHLKEAQGTPQDTTTNKNHSISFSGGQSLPAVVGNGISLFGNRDNIIVPNSASLNLANGFTLSAWVKIKYPGSDSYLFSQSEHDKGIYVGIRGEEVYARVVGEGMNIETKGKALLTLGDWHHVAVAGKPGGNIAVFIDGKELASAALSTLPTMITKLYFGSDSEGTHHLAADIDEIMVSTTARPAAWVQAQFASQGIESKLVSYGAETTGDGGGALSGSYMSTIASNVTLDGWIVMFIMLVLGSSGMLVLVTKAYSLHLNQKDSKEFKTIFAQTRHDFNYSRKVEELDNSSLYRIYQNGCETISSLFQHKNDTASSVLNKKDMNTLRADLEKSYIEETKKLNNWIMILTLGISGGPFLGLLGTVWGVMTTFAAMAEAGEANIMAIAPGIASALATTVSGLLVAIPAMFGYNYLIGKIKDQSADIGIFIDEFILLVERHHGEEQ